jgi:anti-sigma regulatory factor (Ser/Thr protein kinase)
VERRGSNLERSLRQLSQLLGDPGRTVEQLIRRIVSELGAESPEDDVALLIARVPPRPGVGTLVQNVAANPEALAEIRRRVAETVSSWGVGLQHVDEVVLVACELVTNALVHGRPPVQLRVRRSGSRAVLEVHDYARVLPQLRHPGMLEEHGRGLQLVEALAERWGTRPTSAGKWTWCDIALYR